MMRETTQIKLLKYSILLGISLLCLGYYLHNYNQTIEELGVNGIIISAACMALGLIFSLPTKIYLTILLMKQENEHHKAADKRSD